MPQPIFMKLGMYIMAPEPISTAYLLSVFVSVYVSSPIVARQRFGKHIPEAKNALNNRRIIGYVAFYAVRALSKESLQVCLRITLSLLGNGWVNTFSPHRRISCYVTKSSRSQGAVKHSAPGDPWFASVVPPALHLRTEVNESSCCVR
jgi:hypothetical protein